MAGCGGNPVIKKKATTTSSPIPCPQCSCVQPSNFVLLNHIQKAHVKEGFKCPRCPCTFVSKRARLPHMVRIHRERYIIKKGLASLQPCQPSQEWQPPPELKAVCEDDDRKSGKSTATTMTSPTVDNNNDNRDLKRLAHHNIIEEGCDDDEEDTSMDDDSMDDDYEPSHHYLKIANKENCNQPTRRPLVPNTEANKLVPLKRPKLQNTPTTTWYKCKLCGYQSLEKQPLAMHIVDKHDMENLQCSVCYLKVSSAEDLEIHYRDTHRKKIGTNDTTNLVSSVAIIEMNLDDLVKYGFSIKSKQTTDASTHLSDDDDDDIEYVPMIVSKKEKNTKWNWGKCVPPVVRPKTNHKSNMVQLNKSSSDENWVVLSKPTIDGPYTCDRCGITVSTHTNLRRHLTRSHAKGGAFKCKFCARVFGKRAGLRSHNAVRHPDHKEEWSTDPRVSR